MKKKHFPENHFDNNNSSIISWQGTWPVLFYYSAEYFGIKCLYIIVILIFHSLRQFSTMCFRIDTRRLKNYDFSNLKTFKFNAPWLVNFQSATISRVKYENYSISYEDYKSLYAQLLLAQIMRIIFVWLLNNSEFNPTETKCTL